MTYSKGKISVLWCANTPCGAASRLKLQQFLGGWLLGLEDALREHPGLKLHVCFYHHERLPSFVEKNVTYHPVFRSGSSSTRFLRRLWPSFGESREISQLLRVVSEVKPDLIHVHGTEDNFGLVAGMLKTPVLISIQGILDAVCDSFFGSFKPADVLRHETWKRKLLLKTFYRQHRVLLFKKRRESRVLAAARHIAGRTAWDKEITARYNAHARYHRSDEILRSGFYTDFREQPAISDHQTAFRILTVVNDALYKGLDVVLRSLDILHPVLPISWHIAGASRNDYIVRITESLTGINCEKLPIVFHGKKNESELKGLLKQSHVFCQTSYIENSSNSLCEALILGVPVIASRCGGTATMLGDGRFGKMYIPGDGDGLSELIRDVFTNFEMVKVNALKSKIEIRERHDPLRVAEQTVAIYRQILSGR